jgi:tight adherence protein B
MREVLIVLGSVALLALLEACYFVYRWYSDRRDAELRRRLRALGKGGELDSRLLRRGRLAGSAGLARTLAAVPGTARLEALLEQADAPLSVAQLISACAAIAAAGFGFAITMRAGVAAPLFPVLGGLAPILFLLARRSKRSHRLSEQLPEALDMMSRSLRAGHSLPSSFQVVAGEMPQPIAIEFARAYEEQKLGRSIEDAVVQMAGRAPGNGDFQIFAVSTVIQRETGGNLAEILDKIAGTIRERYKFYGKLRALTAEGRASGLVLGALPIGVILMLSVMNPNYLGRLFDNPIGNKILAFAVVSWCAGLGWIWKLTKLEV